MGKIIILILALSFSGCSYVSQNEVVVTGENIKYNPLTRTVSGDKVNMGVKSNRDLGFFK